MRLLLVTTIFFIIMIAFSSCKKSSGVITASITHTWSVFSETETGGSSVSISGLVLGNVTFTNNGQEIRTGIFGPVYGGDFQSISGNNPDTGYYALIGNNTKLAEQFTYPYFLPADTSIATGVGTLFDTLTVNVISNNLLVLSHLEGGYLTIDTLKR